MGDERVTSLGGEATDGVLAREVPSGIVVVDKPLGMRSTQVVGWVKARVRAGVEPALRKRVKVGHGGTLDPLATGVMVVLVGSATKLCERVMGSGKGYLAEVDLSRWSITDDHESEAMEVEGARVASEAEVRAACAAFVGEVMQTPPAHSAIMVGGQRAYALARAGDDPKLAPRPVRIDAIEVVSYAFPLLTIRVMCGRGTYIRSLARDLGRAISGGGMLNALRRTHVGMFHVEQALKVGAPMGPIGPEGPGGGRDIAGGGEGEGVAKGVVSRREAWGGGDAPIRGTDMVTVEAFEALERARLEAEGAG